MNYFDHNAKSVGLPVNASKPVRDASRSEYTANKQLARTK